jgi:hypothetical protein
MATMDLYSNVKVSSLLIPAVRNADANSTAVDMLGFESVVFVVDMGNSADTLSGTNKIELELEESDDDSSFTDCADADVVGYVDGTNDGTFAVVDAPAEDSTVFKCGYRGVKRYVRVVLNFSGTHTTGTPVGVIAVQGHAHYAPVS